jgi:predicted regulator of Ras-like GTPase activity (Roadblock/LC7/MglB family)
MTDLSRELAKISGVIEAVVVSEDGVAYLKVERDHLDEEELVACLSKFRVPIVSSAS